MKTLSQRPQAVIQRPLNPPFKSKILQGDVLKKLASLPISHKFDVVIADPPYNIGKDFGECKDNMPLNEYVRWCKKWLARCFQLLADNGLVYVYGFPEILACLAVKYPLDRQRWLAWHYTNKTTPSSKFWQRSHESILCLWKGGQRPALEIDQIREPYTDGFMNCAGKERAATKGRFSNGGKRTIYKAHDGGACPRDVIKIPALAGGAGARERWFMCRTCGNKLFPPDQFKQHKDCDTLRHSTQKPMELTKKLLLSRINGNGGRVLVPFAGSGSECVVAKAMNIEYLGVEMNPEYVAFARKWLAQKIDV